MKSLYALSLTPAAVLTLFSALVDGQNTTLRDDTLLWGPYRPNLYFGVRPRLPKSLSTGLMWTRVDDYNDIQTNFRYTCEQNEGMEGYGWEEYDIRTGGRQVIHDKGNQIDITTEFVKMPGGEHGGSWAARISGKPREDASENIKTTMIFYAAMGGMSAANPEDAGLRIENEQDPLGYEGPLNIGGYTKDLGAFRLQLTPGPSTNVYPEVEHPHSEGKPLDRTLAQSGTIPEEHVWQARAIVFQTIQQAVKGLVEQYGETDMPPPCLAMTIPNGNIGQGNFHLTQKVFEGAFEFDIIFSSASGGKQYTSEDVTERLTEVSESFKDKYAKVFAAQAPFDGKKYDKFSKTMFSNLLGGVGYFHGDSVVDRSYAEEYDEDNEGFWEDAAEARGRNQQAKEGPSELFSAVPSRPFFPRGFLWDEGFHLLPIADWDTDVTLEVLTSWFNLMDSDGWIAREQILGEEARSKVPEEFQTQYPHYANPPTLFLTIEVILDKLAAGIIPADKREAYITFLRTLYPKLKLHYQWYRKTQSGDLKSYDREAFSTKEAYRWRGRTPQHILPSGLDDYPRAQPPHPGELHVDLLSWMGLMTRSLKRIATELDETSDAQTYFNIETAIVRNLDDLHWDEKAKTFCDATIDAWEESIHVCHKGYISIFPFMTGMLPADSPRLGAILDLISDSNELWSEHGIRSLSRSDSAYGTAENYWRSPVWMNMNYLIVDNLLKVATASESPHRKQATDIYNRLRRNLVDTVYKSWEETGFAWEQYNPETGAGQRTQHFTGWTSLVVKLLCMPDLSGSGGAGGLEHGEL